MNPKQTITVVANIDDRYVMPLTVMARSVMENLSPLHNIDLMILEGGVEEENKKRFEQSLIGYDIKISWRSLQLPENIFTLGSHPGGVAATYFKLFIENFVPDANKVIYLDADMVVQGDLAELLNMPLEGMVLAAAADNKWQSERMRRAGISDTDFSKPESYFNCGLMLIDMEKWRKLDIINWAKYFASHYRDKLWLVDQDLINCVVNGRYKILPPKWNLLEFYGTAYRKYWHMFVPAIYSAEDMETANRAPSIIHYNSFPKPWEKGGSAHTKDAFYHYFQHTVWPQYMELPPYNASISKKNYAQREMIAIMKVLYRELELGRFHTALLLDLLVFIVKHPEILPAFPRLICRNTYWIFRSYIVPRFTAMRIRYFAKNN